MTKRRFGCQILAGCLTLVLCGAGPNPHRRLEKEDPPRFFAALKEGKDHYFRRCFFCHGAHMDGKGPYADALSSPAPGFHGRRLSDEEWAARIVARGYAPLEEAERLALWITGYTGADLRRSEKGERGRRLYRYSCGQCHGYEGDGKGPAAALLDPRPRDFTRGLKRDARRAIEDGVPGTMMPAWRGIFTSEEIGELADYVQAFSTRAAAPAAARPLPEDSRALLRGRLVYEEFQCASCHGDAGRGDGDAGKGLKPADFHKLAARPRDLYRSFMDGLPGTQMSAYRGVLSERRAWDLAYYLRALQERRPPSKAVLALKAGRIPGFGDEAWEKAPKAYFPLMGEVLKEPVHPSPTVDMVEARAFHDGKDLALLLEWDDRFPDPDPPLQRLPDAVEVKDSSVVKWDSGSGTGSGPVAPAAYADGRWHVILKAQLPAWGLQGRRSAPVVFSVLDGASRAFSSERRLALE